MGVQVIPIPNEVVSHSLPFPFPILCFIPIPIGFPVPLGIPFPCTSLAATPSVPRPTVRPRHCWYPDQHQTMVALKAPVGVVQRLGGVWHPLFSRLNNGKMTAKNFNVSVRTFSIRIVANEPIDPDPASQMHWRLLPVPFELRRRRTSHNRQLLLTSNRMIGQMQSFA